MNEQRSPFALPAYRYWFIGSTFQALSSGLVLAVTLTLLALTGDPVLAGITLTCLAALEIFASTIGGAFADSFSRRNIILLSTAVALVAHLAVAGLLLAGVEGLGTVGLVLVILCFALASLGYGFADPAFDGSLKSIISAEHFPRAMSAAQIRSSTLSIVGNPMAGYLFSLAGFLPFALKFICESIFLYTIKKIRMDLGPGVTGNRVGSTLLGLVGSYRQAIAYIKTQPAIARILLCAPLLNLMVFGASSWTAIFLANQGEPGTVVGLVLAGFAVGAIVGGFLTPLVTDRFPAGRIALIGLGAMIIFYACYCALAPSPLLMGLAAFFCMLPSPPLNAGLFSHVYVVTPRELQGRVHALFTLVGGLGAVLAPVLAGFAVAQGSGLLLLLLLLLPACLGYFLLLTSREVRQLP